LLDELLKFKKGRKLIIVDEEVSPATIKDVIEKAWTDFKRNQIQINKLIEYYLGRQNQNSNGSTTDFYGKNIENQTTINYASSTVRTIVGYTYSQGAQITQRKGKHLKDIEKLIDVMNYENSETIDHEIGTMASICGMCYMGLFPTPELYSDYMPDYPVVPMFLDPRTTFTVCSPKPGNPTILSVSYYVSKEKNKTVFYAYTDNERYVLECEGQGTFSKNSCEITDFGRNPMELNPIVLVRNNQFMLGDFELATEISDALNLLASDSISDVENVIKSLLIIMNAEITADEAEKARKNRILQLIGQPGQNVDAKFIYQQLDALGIQNLREYLEEAYKTVVGIPDRKTRSGGGGDTGDAVKLRDGWADIEIVARIKEQYFKIAKKKQLAVAIKILKLLGQVSDGFTLEDIDIKMPRNKHDNIQSKAQSYSTLMSTNTIAPEDALSMADMTNDITGVVERGKKYKEENQDNSYVNSYSNRRNYSNNPQDVDNNVDNSTQE
jgi:SPP1 family phage portal protein